MSKISKMLLNMVVVIAIVSFSSLWAQDTQDSQSRKGSGDGTSVTGCLQKGSGTGEYTIRSDDGKTYNLHSSSSVKLEDHVGHKVTVTGRAAQSDKGSTSSTGSSDMTVTSVKMISASCQ